VLPPSCVGGNAVTQALVFCADAIDEELEVPTKWLRGAQAASSVITSSCRSVVGRGLLLKRLALRGEGIALNDAVRGGEPSLN